MNADPGPGEAGRLRPKLLSVAYRMLGSVADAEDAVQDALLKYQQESGTVASPEPWLIRATTRRCIDRLRQARRRREEYVGPWLPEPVPEGWGGAAQDRLELAESLSMAFLVLLETLSPPERAALLLRDVFDYGYDEIGLVLDASPANARQIVARARKRLGSDGVRFRPEKSQAEDLARRFLAACRAGDVAAIEAMLSADVALYSDGGGKAPAAQKPICGVRRVARLLAGVFRKRVRYCELQGTVVNGLPGAVFRHDGAAVQVTTLGIEGGAIDRVFVVINPDKLIRWRLPESGTPQPEVRHDQADRAIRPS